MQVRIDVAVLSLKSLGQLANWKLKQGSLDAEFLLFSETLIFALKAFN